MKRRIIYVCLGLIAAILLLVACDPRNPTQPSDPSGHIHSFGVWTMVTKPSCTQEGEEVRTCSCGEEETQSVDPLPHPFGEWMVAKAPSCTEQGEQMRVCECGVKERKGISPLLHSVSEWNIVKDSTCTEDGIRTRMCSRCEETKTEPIPATGHTPSEWMGADATCTEAGNRYQYCVVCNENLSAETIPQLGHEYSEEWIVDKEAACTEAGSKSRHCSRCEDTVDVTTIPAAGHDYDPAMPQKLCDGQSINYTCKQCNHKYSEKLTAVSANVVLSCQNYYDSATRIQDIVAINEIKGGYGKYTVTITYTSPTGVSSNYQYADISTGLEADIYLGETGWSLTDREKSPPYVKIEIQDELGFKTTYEATCPTLNRSDYSYGHNDYPDKMFAFDVLAIGHADNQWKLYREATCTRAGQNQLICNACKKILKTETIPAGHDYSVLETFPTCQSKGVTTVSCLNCTTVRSKEWSPVSIDVLRANYSMDQTDEPVHYSALVVKNITGGRVIYDELGNIVENEYTITIYNVGPQEYRKIENVSEGTGSASGSFVDITNGSANPTYLVIVNDGHDSYVFYVWPEIDRATLVGISSEHHELNSDICGRESVCRLCGDTQCVPHATLCGTCPKCEKVVFIPSILMPEPGVMPNGGKVKIVGCAVGAYAVNDTYVSLSIMVECQKSNTTFNPFFLCDVMTPDGWLAGIVLCDMSNAEVVGNTYRKTFTIVVVAAHQYSLSIYPLE